jgi:hypothetical protein
MEREQVLKIEENGKISMDISGSYKREEVRKSESPVVPVVREHCNKSEVVGGGSSAASSSSSCGQEAGGSADDEGSRDEEQEEEEDREECDEDDDLTVNAVQNFLASTDQMTTPRTRRRVESLKQGLAARRIQRTWKHFYEEVRFTLA